MSFIKKSTYWLGSVAFATAATFGLSSCTQGEAQANNYAGRNTQYISQTKYKTEFYTSRGDFCVGFVSTFSHEAVALSCDFQGGK